MLKSDMDTTIQDLKAIMFRFVKTRDFESCHDPKNLAMSISIEAAEFMEIFQFVDNPGSWELIAAKRDHIKDELADVMLYCLSFANQTGIDVSQAIRSKMLKNERKHPQVIKG